jgi:acetyltransferase
MNSVCCNNPEILKYFLEPQSVALIGISRRTGRGSFNIMENLIEYGFQGKIYPVNPKAKEILGQKVYPDVASLPEGIDLAVISTPRDSVPELVKECAGRKIKGIIIITQGFREANDPIGKDLQQELDRITNETKIRILGPNSIGVINAFAGFSSAFIPIPRIQYPVALISQSGGFFEGFTNCPFGKGVDLGNASDLSFMEALSYFEKDPDIRVIVIYMEAISRVSEFIPLARRITRSKPILVLKGGKSKKGRKEAVSHTGSMVGENKFYEALFRKTNLIPINSIAEIGDIVKAYLSLPPFTGDRVAIITPTGAGGILGLDACEFQGFQPANLSSETIKKIYSFFPPWAQTKNPLDILSAGIAHGYKKVYQTTLKSCLDDPGVDVVLAVCGVYSLKSIQEVVAQHSKKPVVAWVIGHNETLIAEKAKKANFHPYYPCPERALNSLRVLKEYYQNREVVEEEKKAIPSPSSEAQQIIQEAARDKVPLTGLKALQFLKACQFPIVPTMEAQSLSQALKVAKELRYPVVLKIESPGIIHKSDVGGVITNIYSPEELTRAYRKIGESIELKKSETSFKFLIQPMISEGEEVILGLKRDPQFGAVLMYGMGGIYTEVFQDVSFRLAPLSQVEALQMIEETQTSRFYQGLRGRPPLDRSAVVESLLKLSLIAEAFPQIKELDINPLTVFPEGVKVIDVRIIL